MTDIVTTIDRILSEGPIGMAAAARLMGTFRAGAATHPTTVTRWCRVGVATPDGRVVKLEHYVAAGRFMTSRAAIVRFIAAQQPPVELPVQGNAR